MSNFSNPEIIKTLKSDFIPVAIDQWYERRQEDTCGKFYRKIMRQGSRNNFERTTQGKYAVAADGTLLGETNHRAPERLLSMLESALEKHAPKETEILQIKTVDEKFARVLPEGGLVVRVHTKILGGYPEAENDWQEIFQNSIARDNLWVRKKEAKAIVDGSFPDTLATRLTRFNLVDNTRGEPPMWSAKEIRKLEIKLTDGVVRGTFHVETENKRRGFEGEFFGIVESSEGKLTRLDIVAKGEYWGEGPYTRNAPEGKFPVAMAFRLADGTDTADRVAPQGSKGWLPNYWE